VVGVVVGMGIITEEVGLAFFPDQEDLMVREAPVMVPGSRPLGTNALFRNSSLLKVKKHYQENALPSRK
jgi:hypothetical protein